MTRRSENSAINLIYVSYALEIFSTRLTFISLPLLLVISEKNDKLGTIFSALAYVGPVLFGYYAGSLVDKMNKRKVGFVASLSIALITFLYCMNNMFYNNTVTILYLAYLSILSYFLGNMRTALIPVLVNKTQVTNANSIMSIIDNSSFFVVPALTSFILKLNNINGVYYCLTICFFVSGLIYLFSLRNVSLKKTSTQKLGFKESWRKLTSYKEFMQLVYIQMSSNAFIGIYAIYILVHAYESKVVALTTVPYILTAVACGAISGSFLTNRINNIFSNESICVLVSLLIMLIVSLTPLALQYTAIYIISSFFVGFFEALIVINIGAARQKIIPTEVIGKITGITSMLYKLAMITAIPLAGFLASYTSATCALTLAVLLGFLGSTPYIFIKKGGGSPSYD